jgi:hypothetical protein
MQPVRNNQQPARINQQPETTEEIVEAANFLNLNLEFIATGAVATYVTGNNADKLPIPNILQRQVQILAQYKGYPIVQQLIKKTINAFNERDYETLERLSELNCCKLTEDQLETLVQENLSKSESYVLEEGGGKFISIARAIRCCMSYGAKVTTEQLDNCLEKAMSVTDGWAIYLLLKLGATRPSREKLNQLLQDYLIQDHHDDDVVISERSKIYWRAIIAGLSIDEYNLLNEQRQEAINNGDYIATHKINGFLENQPSRYELNQAFQATFNNGYTDSKQLDHLRGWLDMGAIASDSQMDLIIKELINKNTLHGNLPLDMVFSTAHDISKKVNALCEIVNFDPSSTITRDQIEESIYLFKRIIIDVTDKKKFTNNDQKTCIKKSLDLGWALATNFFLKATVNFFNYNKKLTKEQLNYGLQQNLKLFQAKDDIREWLSMGSSIQVFEQCFEESLKGDDLIKILNLFEVIKEIEPLNYMLKNQEYINTAIENGIDQLKSLTLSASTKGDDMVSTRAEYLEHDDIIMFLSYSRNPLHRTIPGYFISALLKKTSQYMQVEQINELLPLLLETAIDKLEFGTIKFLVDDMNYKLTDEQRDKIKLNLMSQGIPEYMPVNPITNILKELNLNLNITFTQEELNTGYAKALQDSHSTFDIWLSLGAKLILDNK